MGENMNKMTMCLILSGMVMMGAAYIILNETGKLEKIKAECYNKVMNLKDDIKSKLD